MSSVSDKSDRVRLLPGNKLKEENGSCFRARHALAVMAFLGFFNVYCLRVNLSVALVAMVNSTSSENSGSSDECPNDGGGNSTTTSTGEFDWNEKTQGTILGAFFYGYIVTQLPGGMLAERVGGKRLFGYGCLCTALLTLLTPVAARAGIPYFIAVRVLEGIGEGVTFPAMHAMWAQWAPVFERSKLASFAYSGAHLGTVFAMPISGLLCQHGFAGGWPSVFYVFGALGCVWFVFWMLLVHDSPAQHPRISASEQKYIEGSIKGERERIPTPWRQIAASPAVWAVAVAHFANNWGFYSMLTCLPTYMKKILHFDIAQSGFLSGMPYLVLWMTQMTSGIIADFLRGRGYLSTATTRKMMNTVGSILPACLLVATGYAGCNHTLAVVLLTLGVGGGGFTMAGFTVNHLDIAPKFAGTLAGITNAIATIPGFLGPAVVGIMTNDNETSGQWRLFFYITAGIYLGGAAVFLLLGRGEEQSWARLAPGSLFSVTNQERTVSVQDAADADSSGSPLLQSGELHSQPVRPAAVRRELVLMDPDGLLY